MKNQQEAMKEQRSNTLLWVPTTIWTTEAVVLLFTIKKPEPPVRAVVSANFTALSGTRN